MIDDNAVSPVSSRAQLPHTLAIFESLIDDVPPLVSSRLVQDMRVALDHMEHNLHLTLDEIEDTMIVFAKQLWPYRQAFADVYAAYEARLGESFLLERLPGAMKKRYQEFLTYGGTFRDLHSGQPSLFFSPEERGVLCTALVDVERDVVAHAAQAALSTERERYMAKIEEFRRILIDIEKRLDGLRLMADHEQEHPELAAEIRAQIRSFEHGLSLLGPPHSYEAVCQSEEHFVGRKKEKHMHHLI